MHGPDETAFTDLIFTKVEELLNLPKNTCKIGIMDEERRTSVNLKECIRSLKDRVFFATNKSSLTSASRETLRKQATYLRKNKKLNVTIEGHADERGTPAYNLALGEDRGNAVKQYLMNYGLAESQISVVSYGEERPAAMGQTESAWEQNRRVEIVYR